MTWWELAENKLRGNSGPPDGPGNVKDYCHVPQAVWSSCTCTKARCMHGCGREQKQFLECVCFSNQEAITPQSPGRIRGLWTAPAPNCFTFMAMYEQLLFPPGMPHPAASASGTPPSSVHSPAGGQNHSHNFHHLL